MPNSFTISDKHIDFAEEQMRVEFDGERRQILKCMESKNIQACPGSGKTTTLVAKLLILSQMMPEGVGVCVLSHTNAAREEIEHSLGRYASVLFQYPHFIGTIQKFVNKHLATPALIEKYGIRPVSIDDHLCGHKINQEWNKCRKADKKTARDYLLAQANKDVRTAKDFLRSTSFGVAEFEELERLTPSKSGYKPLPGNNTLTYKVLWSIKENVTRQGYINYRDAYALANWYLKQHPELKTVIANRFQFIFIDEMQDTDTIQSRIIDEVFSSTRCKVQRFGDTNQTIYNSLGNDSDSTWATVPDETLPITTSRRFSPSIAKLCQEMQVDSTLPINGNPEIQDHKHTIFLFDIDSVKNVIPTFAELIISEGLADETYGKVSHDCFKVVGAVKEKENSLAIKSYFPSFEKKQNQQLQPSMNAHFELAHTSLQEGNSGEARQAIVSGLIRILRLENIKRKLSSDKEVEYTEASLNTALKELGEDEYLRFQKHIIAWYKLLLDNQEIDIETATQEILKPFAKEKFSEKTLDFIRNKKNANKTNDPIKNIYQHSTHNLTIGIDTIHGVKGQTHIATLVLETYWYSNNLKCLLPYLKGEHPNPRTRNKKRLHTHYVAMTRPRRLLCLAVNKTDFEQKDIESLRNRGWNIAYI